MLIDFGEGGREREEEEDQCEREESIVASHVLPKQGPNPQPRHVP